MTKFEATVRKQKSKMGLFGRITSRHLVKYIDKKVNISIKNKEQLEKWALAAEEYKGGIKK